MRRRHHAGALSAFLPYQPSIESLTVNTNVLTLFYLAITAMSITRLLNVYLSPPLFLEIFGAGGIIGINFERLGKLPCSLLVAQSVPKDWSRNLGPLYLGCGFAPTSLSIHYMTFSAMSNDIYPFTLQPSA